MRKTRFILFVLAFMMFGVMNAEIASGTCGKEGDNITWVLDSDGTLTLSGSGEMEDYSYNSFYYRSTSPWDNNTNIIKILIDEGITSIGKYAFHGCTNLISVVIPNSVTSIGHEAFFFCRSLTSVIIPNSVTSIGDYAFYYCGDLTSVTIGNSVTSIGDYAFSYCSALTYLIIGNSVTNIGQWAFTECGLTSVTIPDSVTSVGYHSFYNCSSLTSVTIGNSVVSIGDGAFESCSGLASVSIPNSVTSIGNNAFCDCIGLASVTIPNSVTSIGNNAFFGCIGLTSVTIGNSVKSIGGSAFAYCENIKTIYYNLNASCDFQFSSINEVHYVDDITVVYPISLNLNLTKVVLGKNVECIRPEAFRNAPLKEFYITGEKDIYLYQNVFQNVILSNATLYVPKSRAEYYTSAAPWNEFGKILDLDGNELPKTNKEQCAAPTITYTYGKLIYHTDTEDAEIVSEVRVDDAKISYGVEVPLSATYNITAYATKSGFDNSEVVTATLVWIDAQLITDTPSDVQAVKARPILISSNDGNVTIKGLEDNENVDVYSLSGAKLNSVKSVFGTASFYADKGNVVIVKIGDKSIKVVVK